MSHYVLVQPPRQKSFYVICGDVDECLAVVGDETSTAPVGTRVTMLRSTGGDVLDVLSAWRVEKRGQARRYAINAGEAAGVIKELGGRVRYSDGWKKMNVIPGEPRWTAFVTVLGHDSSGDGETKPKALRAALDALPPNVSRHFGAARGATPNETDIAEGDVLRLKLKRLPVYDSPHASSERETSQLVTVRKLAADGRLIVRMKGKKPGYNAAVISADRSEMSGQGPAGKRPFRYLILNIEHAA